MNILLERSLINCHCEGMDSLVVKDAPGMVRIFIARHDHQLWRNDPTTMKTARMSVALHKHHCDITLMPIFGEIYNITPSMNSSGTVVAEMLSFKYSSPILVGEVGGFVPIDKQYIPISIKATQIVAPYAMSAREAHTVYVPRGKTAAWFVWEGEENPAHNPIVYSNDDCLPELDFSKLDQPMTPERLRQDLALIGVRS